MYSHGKLSTLITQSQHNAYKNGGREPFTKSPSRDRSFRLYHGEILFIISEGIIKENSDINLYILIIIIQFPLKKIENLINNKLLDII